MKPADWITFWACGLGFINLKTADAFEVRLEDETISVFDVYVVGGQGGCEQFEIADFVGDEICDDFLSAQAQPRLARDRYAWLGLLTMSFTRP